MPPRTKKKPAAKQAEQPQNDQNIAILKTELVPINALQVYHKNPRVGNVDEIAKSLHINSQFKPVVVNVGTHTGRQNEILAGNHTWLAARREVIWQENGKTHEKPVWEYIYASFVDVDDETATRIVLADNATSDKGTYDDSLLAELLHSLPEISGSGYTFDEVDDILKDFNTDDLDNSSNLDDVLSNMPDAYGDEDTNKDPKRKIIEQETEEDRQRAEKRGATRTSVDDDKDINELEDAQAELQGMLQLKEDLDVKTDDEWGIVPLRRDMMMERLPEKLTTWGGLEATPDDDPEKWFFYNYSLGGTKGLPWDRTILAFDTFDDKFINWYSLPSHYTAKMLNVGVKYAVVPDFSFYEYQPKAFHLWNVYMAQWLGRYFQECGIKIIPRVQFNNEESLDICMRGIPHSPPILHCSVQNLAGDDKSAKAQDEKLVVKMLQHCVDELEPTNQLLVYGGNPGKRVLEQIKVPDGCEKVHLMNYAGVRRGTAYDKKEGIAGLDKDKKKALKKKLAASKISSREE